MKKELPVFLATVTPLCTAKAIWGNGTMPLQITYYASNKQPPLEYVSSVRAIVFRRQEVLLITQKSQPPYIVPGGRVEKGEKQLETLRREIREETGWTITKPKLLGGMHFHHLAPKPAGYKYPHPDFLWPIYQTEAKDFDITAIQPDEWVHESHFQPLGEVKHLGVSEGELLLLETAIKEMKNGRPSKRT